MENAKAINDHWRLDRVASAADGTNPTFSRDTSGKMSICENVRFGSTPRKIGACLNITIILKNTRQNALNFKISYYK